MVVLFYRNINTICLPQKYSHLLTLFSTIQSDSHWVCSTVPRPWFTLSSAQSRFLLIYSEAALLFVTGWMRRIVCERSVSAVTLPFRKDPVWGKDECVTSNKDDIRRDVGMLRAAALSAQLSAHQQPQLAVDWTAEIVELIYFQHVWRTNQKEVGGV